MVTVFDVFKETNYDYLEIARGTVYGNRITSTTPLRGIFKLRSGMTQGVQEVNLSSATIHAHPEDFADYDSIVGNGVKYDGIYYRISGITGGRNFADGKMEHLTFTLEREDELAAFPVVSA